MIIWTEAQIRQLTQGSDIQSTFEVALSLIYEMGFEYCAFAVSPHSQSTHTHTVKINNYPEEWNKKYETHNYVAIDPIIKYCSQSVLPILWDDNAFSTAPAFWEETQTYGMRYGWSQSVHDLRGFFSVLSLSRSHQPITALELYGKAGQLIWLSNTLHTIVTQKMLSAADFHDGTSLSSRETEVLKWSSDGKTASDIAAILNLSERTVNFHVSSAIKKLGVNNKISAVVHAARKGLL
jgi:DNA-binding CsgD family transcriptional regulator